MGLVLGQSWIRINRRILFCPPIIMYCEVGCCLHIHSVVNVLLMQVRSYVEAEEAVASPVFAGLMNNYYD